MFCFHKWVVVSVAHTQPVDKLNYESVELHGPGVQRFMEFTNRQLTGVTSVALRCSKCGTLKSEDLTGIHQFPQETKGQNDPARTTTD